ncbi:MAG: two-component regulator propeller domain-containing protein [Bryobacteraceae bacterium]|jgi:ligand-binding sensor domain-containing protein/signal transduction histidine kinase
MGSAQKKPVVWLVLLLTYSACAFALDPSLDVSQYAHTAWTVREGFVKGTIFSVAQTPDGYLWLATESGLYRFDGVLPVLWQPPQNEQLPDNFVHDILVTRDGTLWIGTPKGLASLKDGKLTQYPEVAGHRVGELSHDAEGKIWFGVTDPGRLCTVRAAKTQCYGGGSFGESISALYEDRKGNLWAAAQTGLWRWAPGTPEHYLFPGGAQPETLLEDGNGTLLLTTRESTSFGNAVNAGLEGLKQLVDGKIRSYPLPVIAGQFGPTKMLRSRDGSLWIGTVQGLLHLHQGRIDKFSVSDGLSSDIVTCFFEDREGDVWVGTQTGLDRFREFAIPTVSVSQGLSSAAVDLLEATPDGSIWIATADGLNRWQNGHVSVYGRRIVPDRDGRTSERERIIDARVTEIENSGLRNTVFSLGHDDLGRLWVGSREGVVYFDGGRFVPVPGLPGGDVLSIAGDGDGKVWISSNDSLSHWTPEGAVQRFPWARFGHKQAATALLPDRLQGGLWIGFLDGGLAYLKDGQLRSSYNVADGLGNGSVLGLQLGSDGAVWAATEGGLSRVKDGRITTLTSRNGLPCDAVFWAMEDGDRSFWLQTPCGLVRIARTELEAWMSDSKRSVQTKVYDASDGVWSRGRFGTRTPIVAKSPDGKIWFQPPDGASVIDPRHLPFNKLPPPVYVEQITADGRKFDASRGLRLPARVRDLEIDYTALSLAAPEKNRFRYKLEGYDRDWQDAGKRRQAFYSNLSPQNYRFRVMASNNSGVWNETGASLEFSIAPAYYQTTWFRLSLVAAFFALLWALYQYRLRQIAREFSANLEGRVDERLRVARELHDTLLQTFQAALIEFQAARNLFSKGREEAIPTLDSAIGTAQEAIVEGRDAIQDLRRTGGPRTQLERLLKTAGQELASSQVSNGNRPSFRVTVEGPAQDLSPVLQDEIYQIGREVLRNAFRHASASRIEAEIHYDNRLLRLRIRDDGKGLDPKVLKDGMRPGHWGLPGIRERAKRIGARLVFWSEAGAGTEVELAVPSRIAYEKSTTRRRFGLFPKGS